MGRGEMLEHDEVVDRMERMFDGQFRQPKDLSRIADHLRQDNPLFRNKVGWTSAKHSGLIFPSWLFVGNAPFLKS